MRTPLNIALMGLNSVENDVMARLQDGNADSDEVQTIRDVKSAIVTAAEICTDLLDSDKVEDKQFKIACVYVPVLKYIEESIQMFSMNAKEKDVNFYFDGFKSIPSSVLHSAVSDGNESEGESFVAVNDCMYIDVSKVRQVLRNIMSNAFKFTPSGKSVTVRVRKTLEILPSKIGNASNDGNANKVSSLPNWCKSFADRFCRWFNLRLVSPSADHEYLDIENGVIGDQNNFTEIADIRSPIGTLIIDVIDSGVGIAIEDQDRLFKEIVQFNPSVLQGGGGSGLGMMVSLLLPCCRQL